MPLLYLDINNMHFPDSQINDAYESDNQSKSMFSMLINDVPVPSSYFHFNINIIFWFYV